MAYLLDTNILVNAKRTYCGFDICPDFWGWLLHENNQGNIFSIDEVHEEIVNPKDRSNNPLPNTHQSYNDDLSQWAEGEGKSLFLTHNQESVNGYIELGCIPNYLLGQARPRSSSEMRLGWLSRVERRASMA